MEARPSSRHWKPLVGRDGQRGGIVKSVENAVGGAYLFRKPLSID